MDKRHEAALAEAEAFLKKGDAEGARFAIRSVLQENPKHGRALLVQRQADELSAKALQIEPRLQAKFARPVTLQFRDANLKQVFEALARTSGINVLLDRDVKPDLKTSIFVKDVSVEDTIELILLQNQLEKKVISDNTVFIYPSTPAKLKDYQDLKIRSFHLTNADPKQILAMLKGLLKTKDVFIHEKTNSVVMRDTPDAIRLAEKLVADQDIAEPEVMLEVEVLEVSSTRLSELGIKLPSSFTVTTPDTATTLGALRALRNDDLLASGLSASLNLKLEDGVTNVLASPRIRVRNREKAKIMIGSRVPVITNAVTPVSTGTPVITGSVQYLDVGLKLDVEPDVHNDQEVVIKVGLDVSSIIREVPNAQSGTLAYEIGTRNANTVLRLKDGETQILAGLINDEDRRTASKVPGLGQIPVLGRLFSSHKDDNKKTEIVLSITPRIVGSARLPDAGSLEYWSGTESNLRGNPLNLKAMGSVAINASGNAGSALQGRLPVRKEAQAGAQNTGVAGPLTVTWQGPAQAKLGEIVSLTLNAQTAQALGALGLSISYDTAVLRAVEVEEGGFMKQNGMQPVFARNIDASSGQIVIDLTGRNPDGVSGNGSIATLVFETVGGKARSPVTVGRIAPAGPGGETLVASLPEPFLLTVLP
jgi:general secretion pathway protein D